jgi:hypothetical protein
MPEEWEVLVWNNGEGDDRPGLYKRVTKAGLLARRILGDEVVSNLSVFGRYAAIKYAEANLIYVQDDDVILSREAMEEIVWECDSGGSEYGRLVCNMPQRFREQEFYSDSALVGFGACFHRDLPEQAFARWWNALGLNPENHWRKQFNRDCDLVFTGLTPYYLVDLPYEDLPWASEEGRLWREPGHIAERAKMRELVRKVREA